MLGGANPRFAISCLPPATANQSAGSASDFEPPAWCNCTSAAFSALARGSPFCELEAATLNALYVDVPPRGPCSAAGPHDADATRASAQPFSYRDQSGRRRTVVDTWDDYLGWVLPVLTPAALADATASVVDALPRGAVDTVQVATGQHSMVATPAYSFDGNSSISVPTTTLDALSAQVFAHQVSVRRLSKLPAPPARISTASPSISRDLERLFPSAAVEIRALNATGLRSSIALTSFWGEPTDWPYATQPDSWPGDSTPTRHSVMGQTPVRALRG